VFQPRDGLNEAKKPVGEPMAKRRRTSRAASGELASRQPRRDIIHTSVYLPAAVHEVLRQVAFKERCKIHDIVLEGIELALRKRKGR
jgi:hypothetical protein